MTTERLDEDLRALEEMAAKMEDYLNSENLFWQAHKENVPEPTIGQYLMRQHRLNALKESLDSQQQRRLEAATRHFDQITHEKRVYYKQKAHQEFKTRLRLWSEALKEILEDEFPSMAFYRTDVEDRVVLEALLETLKAHSVQLEPEVAGQLEQLDRKLRQRWEEGAFVWPKEWQPAYPRSNYWWLYGELA